MHAKVLVTLRSGVLDPAGQAVADGLRQLGFDEVRVVRIGKVLEVQLDEGLTEEGARARLAEMAEKLLANPVIEDFDIEIHDGPRSQ
ncbi:MAG: phosphoribosylformylglycinamidine synthase subunit PurS [Myxococcota bacterium]